MAITSRASRNTLVSTFTTPDVVGPGSYLKTERDAAVHGFAPFSSTVERPNPGDSASKANPGPGTYSTALDNTIGRTLLQPNGVPPGAGAAFTSKVQRMPGGSVVRAAEPGPGAYTLRDDWERVAASAAASAAAAGAAAIGKARAAPPAKSAGPPSIPVHEQSYGYEETGDGGLKMQKPTHPGFTGVSGHRSVGPGDYEPTRASTFTHKAAPISSFGNSRVVRSVFAESKDTPGPGSYVADSNGARGKPSAAFLSRVPLAHQRLLDSEKLNPGPGAYSAPMSISLKSVPENLQAFGSTQKRLASDAVTPAERQRMAQPGPGAYEERRSDFRGASASADHSAISGKGAAASTLAAEQSKGGRSGFSSSTVRFTPLGTSARPGPGAYDENDQHSFVANLGRKTHGRNGVFGSTTRRFHTLKQDPVPGAGAYNPVKAGANEAERDDGLSSAFASGVQRFTKSAPTRVSAKVSRDKDAVPPPWQYNPRSENAWERPLGSPFARPMPSGRASRPRSPLGRALSATGEGDTGSLEGPSPVTSLE